MLARSKRADGPLYVHNVPSKIVNKQVLPPKTLTIEHNLRTGQSGPVAFDPLGRGPVGARAGNVRADTYVPTGVLFEDGHSKETV